MNYEIPFCCPILSPRYFLSCLICPCLISSILYSKIFRNQSMTIFPLICVPFAAYNIRRYVQTTLKYGEHPEKSFLKSFCCCFSLTQDLHEMEANKIGVFKYYNEEPDLDNL
ncbi:hypothetical protein M153_2100027886 [Pseudoloma neurophilia]|uniref:Uncharacterized protein n=1 Tax=Pseudoloma neurophilia TaxID=146866 RepID=A0A0R0M1J9_9MICR|nr:hypothetical protein M153_2100027886 [Pseudoloma neurophilia]